MRNITIHPFTLTCMHLEEAKSKTTYITFKMHSLLLIFTTSIKTNA